MRKSGSILLTLGIVAAGLAVTSTSAGAAVRAPFSYTIHRLADENGSLDFRVGESATITATLSLGPDWTGWPDTRPATMTFTQGDLLFTESTYPDEVSDAPGVWHYYSSTDPECDYWAMTTSLSLPLSRSCVDSVDLVTELYGEQFESDHSITFDTSSWGIYRSGVRQTAAHNATSAIYADVTGTSDSSESLSLFPGSDVSVAVEIEGCVDESAAGLVDGDSVVQEVIASIDGTPISETANSNDPVVSWTTAPSYDSEGNEVVGPAYPNETIRFTEEPAENVTIGLTGEISHLTGSTLTIEYDITKEGASVAENCPLSDFVGLPTVADTSETGEVFDAHVDSYPLPDGMTIDASDVRTIQFTPDGFGGQFVFPEDEWGEASTGTVFHLNPDGPDNTFSGGNGFPVSSVLGLIEFKATAWGTGGTKWATIHYSTNTTFTITTGTFGSSAVNTLQARLSKIDSVCGRGWIGYLERFLPLQTPQLLAEIQCSKYTSTRSYNKTVIARVTTSATRPFRAIATIGKPTKKTPGTCTAIGIDPTATGTDTALIGMTRQLKKGLESCADMAARGTIVLTRINTNYGVSRKKVTSNPFAGGTLASWPSDSMTIVPGETTNTWRGVQQNREWDDAYENSTMTWTPFTINSGKTIVELPDIVAADRFGTGNIDAGTLVAAPGGSDWLLFNLESDDFDGDTTLYATTSTVNPLTGITSSGEHVQLTDFGYTQTWMYQSATSQNGVPLYYVLGADDTFSVVTWNRSD